MTQYRVSGNYRLGDMRVALEGRLSFYGGHVDGELSEFFSTITVFGTFTREKGKNILTLRVDDEFPQEYRLLKEGEDIPGRYKGSGYQLAEAVPFDEKYFEVLERQLLEIKNAIFPVELLLTQESDFIPLETELEAVQTL